MTLLPYRRFTIDTPLSPSTVQTRLEGATGQTVPGRASPIDSAFRGEVSGARFQIQRRIGYRNSFLPRIRGTIEPTASGSRLVGTMRLHGFVAAFMVFWLGGVGLAFIAIVLPAFSGGRFDWGALTPLGMLAFGVLLVLGGFVPEAHKAIRQLAELVDASRSEMH